MCQWKNKIGETVLVQGFDDAYYMVIQVIDTDSCYSYRYILEAVMT